MNKLERAILDGAIEAQKAYGRISDGCWLGHGPESFIQPYVAEEIAEEGFVVYPEKSPKKLDEELEVKRRGRPPGNKGERFDLVVWYRTRPEVLAIIEIKRAYYIGPVRRDAEKVKKHLSHGVAKTGYLLVYSVAGGYARRTALESTFKRWAKQTETTLVGHHIVADEDDEWSWGFVLLRLNRKQRTRVTKKK